MKLALDQWEPQKPIALRMLAQELATGTEVVYDLCELARKGENVEGGRELPPLDTWLDMYRKPLEVISSVLGTFWDVLPPELRSEDEVALVCAGADWLERSEAEQRAELAAITVAHWRRAWREAQQVLCDVYEKHLEGLRLEIETGGPEAAGVRAQLVEALSKPEVRFFFRVSIPCWLAYGKEPGELLDEACADKLGAVERMLRLDKRALAEPGVQKVYDRVQVQGNRTRVQDFHRALEEAPRGTLTLKGIKVLLGALLQKTAAEWDAQLRVFERQAKKSGFRLKLARMKLTAPSIRRLFDLAAQDMHGHLVDADLAQAPHGWYMALRRAQDFWPDGLLFSQE